MITASPGTIRAELKVRGWSLTKAAQEAKLSRPTIRRMANGHPVTEESALALTRALERSQPELLRILEAAS